MPIKGGGCHSFQYFDQKYSWHWDWLENVKKKLFYLTNIVRITKCCPENIESVVKVPKCFLIKKTLLRLFFFSYIQIGHSSSFFSSFFPPQFTKSFVTIWVFRFCHNLSLVLFWVIEFCHNLSFVTIWFFVTFLVFEFFTIWVF